MGSCVSQEKCDAISKELEAVKKERDELKAQVEKLEKENAKWVRYLKLQMPPTPITVHAQLPSIWDHFRLGENINEGNGPGV
jgi:hypothetical protein